jgi:hypothetical protein
MTSYVYKITNDLNEMVYIGTTTRPLCKRISDHRYNAIRRGNTSKLYEYMREIGVERFKIVCVREYKDISKERLKSKEEKYIRRYDSIKNGLNMHSMGGYNCIHDKLKRYCIECDGSSMCIHKKIKRTCVDCKGRAICIRDKVKYKCVECKGSTLCIHQKQKSQCKICSPAVCDNCNKTYAGKRYLKTHQTKCKVNQ